MKGFNLNNMLILLQVKYDTPTRNTCSQTKICRYND